MSAERMLATAVDPDGKWLYRVGGASALLLGIGYIVIFPLYASVGAPPSGAEAWLEYSAGKTAAWWAILGISVLTDLLFIPIALALYLALNRVDRNAMLVGTSFVLLFVVLDLAVTWTNYAARIALSENYAAATTDVQRTAYVAAATFASAVLTSTLVGVYSIVTLSVGILIVGLVMLRAGFSKGSAYLGVATGILGIFSVAGPLLVPPLGVVVIIASVLTTVWLLLVGYRLIQLGRH